MKKVRIFFVLGVILLAVAIFLYWNRTVKVTYDGLTVIDQMYELITQQSVYKTSSDTLIEGALRGMANAIEDPYSTYYSQKEAVIHNQTLAEQRIGIGVELAYSYGKFIIVSPVKSSPAEKAGIRPLDEIVQIDGQAIAGKSVAEVMQLMHGKEGEEIALTIYRPQLDKHVKVAMERAVLKNETVDSDLIDTNDLRIGYISISLFAEKTAEEWWSALENLRAKQPAALVIDVRDNPGGYLHAVAQVISTFDSTDQIYAYMQNQQGAMEALKTVASNQLQPLEKMLRTIPIVVLQNEGSASASEVFTGALQNWQRATIVGITSFGKGTVQETWSLQNGGEIKLSTNRWLTPSQQWIHKKGIVPDIVVEQHPLFAVQLMPFQGTFTVGDMSEEVAYVQMVLHELGYQMSRMDGYFDQETVEVIKIFRENFDLAEGQDIDEAVFEEVQQQILTFKNDPENDLQRKMAISFLQHQLQQ